MRTQSASRWFLVIPLWACLCSAAFGSGPARPVAPEDSTPPQYASPALGSAKQGPLAKVGRDLAVVASEYSAYEQRGRRRRAFTPSNALLAVTEGRVSLEAVAAGDVQALRADLAALGMRQMVAVGRIVSGQFPLAALADLAALETLQFARPAYVMTRKGAVTRQEDEAMRAERANTGAVTSEGDAAMRADVARATFGVDGSDVIVGVISDSFNCLGGAEADEASGDLPPGVVVLAEQPDCSGGGGSDEGRAMLQIVHDVAPGATLVFHTGAGGQPGLAAAILALADAGADVIVDDLYSSLGEPMFQDGIVAQTVEQVVRRGVAYFTFAGNERRDSYQSPFRPSGIPITIGGQPAGEAHDFDPGPDVDIFQRITVLEGDRFRIVLQWDAPFFSVSGPPGSPNDLDLYLLDDPPTTVLARSDEPNISGDAVEAVEVDNPVGSGVTTFNILIVRSAGLNPGLLKYVLIPNFLGTIDEFNTRSGTVYGHRNASGAATIGGASFRATPAFGVDPPRLWRFSSSGPTPILFNTAGQRLLRPEIRRKPELVAPTGGNNTFWGEDVKSDPDTYPNFFGTSASAPHAAAVAALMLQVNPTLSPWTIYTILESTAADMRTPGFDFASGFGLIQADRALQAVPGHPVICQGLLATIVGTPGNDIITGTPGRDIIQGRGGDDIIKGLGGDDVICGGRDTDVLYGGAGHDRLDGGDSSDFCDGGNPIDGDTAGRCEITVNTP